MEGAAAGSPGGERPGVRSGGRGAELVPEARDASGGEGVGDSKEVACSEAIVYNSPALSLPPSPPCRTTHP
jgi:hypothetical protein